LIIFIVYISTIFLLYSTGRVEAKEKAVNKCQPLNMEDVLENDDNPFEEESDQDDIDLEAYSFDNDNADDSNNDNKKVTPKNQQLLRIHLLNKRRLQQVTAHEKTL
jgi:hypothetical protein